MFKREIWDKLKPILNAVLKQGVLRLFSARLGSAWHASVLDEENIAVLKQFCL